MKAAEELASEAWAAYWCRYLEGEGWIPPQKDTFYAGFLAAQSQLEQENARLREALEFYANYPASNKEIPHIDIEWLKPERVAIIKPIEKLGNSVNEHPSTIYQDNSFTYGPKYRIGKIARKALEPSGRKE